MTEGGNRFADVVAQRLTRRAFLKGAAAMVVYLPALNAPLPVRGPAPARNLSFAAIAADDDDRVHVAAGHTVAPLLSWADPVFEDAPSFDPQRLTAAAQARQFGYNCDFVGFLPLPLGSGSSSRGLLVVNHEYTNPELMFEAYEDGRPTPDQVAIQLAAHGMSVVALGCDKRLGWRVDRSSPFNRRITGTSRTLVTGPAAGHRLLKTESDPTGTTVAGTLANCSAGITPWGTILSAEENFHLYFGHRDRVDSSAVRKIHARYGVPREASDLAFEQVDERFDLGRTPHEPFRFGWVVELDPYDRSWVPRKRTALGRLRREGAACVVAPSGQVVLYSGDDIQFEYVYKFVTRDAYAPGQRARNRNLLDEGTLYVARFDHDGTGVWLPLVHGVGPINTANGFDTQADVVINPLKAADLMVPTKMDRPEDVQVSPVTGRVYVSLTSNPNRGTGGHRDVDAANPRRINTHGHIIEITEARNDHAALRFTWEIFMLCGDPDDEDTYFAGFPKQRVSAISRPDNLTFDRHGDLWVATDGQPKTMQRNDGLYAVPTDGPDRGYVRRFLSAVPGSEICSPRFTPDGRTLFASIQHPGEGSRLDHPSSSWPDGLAPRPSVVVVQQDAGHEVGRA